MFSFKTWCTLALAALLCSLPAAALTLDMAAVANAVPAAQKAGTALCVQKKGWNILVVPDAAGKAAALFLTRAEGIRVNGSALLVGQELVRHLGLENPQRLNLAGGGLAFLAEDTAAEPKHIIGCTPFQGLHFLLKRGYYHLSGVTDAGEAELVSGKKRSIDLRLPLTAETLNAVELTVTGVNMDTFAANVLADKLGYGADNSTPEEKKALKTELKAKEVYYLQRKRKIALAAVGRRFFFGDAAAIGTAATAKEETLEYPDAAAPRIISRPQQPAGQETKPTPTPPAAPQRPLTPAEALKAYIKHLEEL